MHLDAYYNCKNNNKALTGGSAGKGFCCLFACPFRLLFCPEWQGVAQKEWREK